MSDREFTIVRVFDAPRELVFQAWVDPDQLTEWAGPQGFSAPRDRIVVEPRVGGRYDAVLVSDADGSSYPTAGVFREIVAPERLVFTWSDPTGKESVTPESVVTVTFAETHDGKTSVSLHLLAPGPLSAEDGAEDGWAQSLDRLAALLRL
ncbi:SRPBCC domain-containing protein [Nocardia amamiensis]|uniref:SRPBCC domain-containing protein n=1 Tax=Nocardia amamiensis TaxID=404578 RepID=A0ABS0CYQ9_9NOCA|nr:SRPBCC domain-containing protein [Nocardia amamiensis]MBF6299953.1 SRPBCC domain-containing protein [Nocardia amamiensis]